MAKIKAIFEWNVYYFGNDVYYSGERSQATFHPGQGFKDSLIAYYIIIRIIIAPITRPPIPQSKEFLMCGSCL